MRKYLFIIMTLLFIFEFNYFCNFDTIYAMDNGAEYYRITTEDALFYRTDSGDKSIENVYCVLPKSYFVKLNSETDNDYISVSYLGLSGYVNKQYVIPVYSTPETPYSIRSFAILPTANAVMWSLPDTTSTYLGSIPYNISEVIFLGETTGQKLNETDNGVWYLCEFMNDEAKLVVGYIHSNLATNLTEFCENTEEVLLEPVISTGGILAPEITNTSSLLLILLLTIPAVLILTLILKPKRSKARTAKRQIASLNQLSLKDKNSPDEFDF